ncbi:hypothetical protein POM88_030338 [Heracleum sosnowskyi]|uniref:Uncharacterized protein n=1 Tax=Heracleum sosnowskyi TaxID=360622 RepID=A0AAD8MFN8_9APIA|nr:hypothetical protein POM88_030338 [Heracleum sosnowskyi]
MDLPSLNNQPLSLDMVGRKRIRNDTDVELASNKHRKLDLASGSTVLPRYTPDIDSLDITVNLQMPEDVVVLGTNEDLASRPRSVTLSFDCEQRHKRAIPSDVVENPQVKAAAGAGDGGKLDALILDQMVDYGHLGSGSPGDVDGDNADARCPQDSS